MAPAHRNRGRAGGGRGHAGAAAIITGDLYHCPRAGCDWRGHFHRPDIDKHEKAHRYLLISSLPISLFADLADPRSHDESKRNEAQKARAAAQAKLVARNKGRKNKKR